MHCSSLRAQTALRGVVAPCYQHHRPINYKNGKTISKSRVIVKMDIKHGLVQTGQGFRLYCGEL